MNVSRHHIARTIVVGIAAIIAACAAPQPAPQPPLAQVLFVCEHGNVKSLMAASYFNRMAEERGLPFRGVSRGSAPDSTTVPDAIVRALHADGFDVSDFRPVAVSREDVAESLRVIAIGVALPATAAASDVEHWSDVPAASTSYPASRDSLRSHVKELLDELSRRGVE